MDWRDSPYFDASRSTTMSRGAQFLPCAAAGADAERIEPMTAALIIICFMMVPFPFG